MIGATGRVYLSGREDDVRQAAEAVTEPAGRAAMTAAGGAAARTSSAR